MYLQLNMALSKIKYLLVLVVIFYSCKQRKFNVQYVLKTAWNHDSGYKIGERDYIFFDTTHKVFELIKDTIFYKGIATALITDVNENTYTLTISSLKENSVGVYVDDNQALKEIDK